jgi:hypothetical protein
MKKLIIFIFLNLLVFISYAQLIEKPTATKQSCDSIYYKIKVPAGTNSLTFKTNRKSSITVLSTNLSLISNSTVNNSQQLAFNNTLFEDTLYFAFKTACTFNDTLTQVKDTLLLNSNATFVNSYLLNIVKFESFNVSTQNINRTEAFLMETRYKLQKGFFGGIAVVRQTKKSWVS